MSEALAARGHTVHVVTYHLGGPIDSQLVVHRISDVRAYTRTAAGPTWRKLLHLDLLLARLLTRVLGRHHCDVIYAHHYEGLLAGLWGRHRSRIPVVYDAHTLLEWEVTTYPLGLPRAVAAAIGRRLDRSLPARADRVVAVTGRIRDELTSRGHVREDRISVAASGVEASYFDAMRRVGDAGRRGPVVVFAGNLAPYQGIDVLLDAFKLVLEHSAQARLRMVTTEPFAPYEGRARELGVRDAIDIVPADGVGVVPHLAEADIAVNPRVRSDGLPQKLLNYMAAGVPIVSFAGSAGPLRHGETGWLVPDGDVRALADGILHCVASDAGSRALGERARRVARAEFSWERAALAVDEVFQAVVGRVA
jgi:glycosyltransferase involved in cell wall biosynthesis